MSFRRWDLVLELGCYMGTLKGVIELSGRPLLSAIVASFQWYNVLVI